MFLYISDTMFLGTGIHMKFIYAGMVKIGVDFCERHLYLVPWKLELSKGS